MDSEPSAQPAPAAVAPQARRRRGLVIGIAAAAAVVLAVAVTGVVLLVTRGESPAAMAQSSGQAMASAAGLTFTGSTAGGSASLTVTRAGTAEGRYTQDGDLMSCIEINGVTYLKAPATFWTDEDVFPEPAAQAAGRWAKAPAVDINLNFASLSPAQISRTLEHVGPNPRVVDSTLDGSKVIKLSDRGASYYITTASPNRLLRIAGGSGVTSYSLDVTRLRATTIGRVFATLHADVRELQGAADPGALIVPAPKIDFGAGCTGPVSCTVSIKVTVTDPDSPATMLKMTVYFSATSHGTPFATCADQVVAATGGALNGVTVRPSCGLSGSVWARWVDSHSVSFYTWAGPDFEPTVNSAGDIAAPQNELDRQ